MNRVYNVTDADEQELKNRFTYHKPKDNQPERYEEIREAAFKLAKLFMECAPNSRERSVALTNLEQAVMWENAAIARNE